MTIVVALKTSEGLILGSDSAVSLTNSKGEILNVYEYAEKLCQLKDYPIGILTWGAGSIGDRSIKSLINEFGSQLMSAEKVEAAYTAPKYTVREITGKLRDFFKKKYDEEGGQASLGIYIGGYSENGFFPEGYEFQIPDDDKIERIFPDENGKPAFGVIWRGITGPITRLLKGYDVRVLRVLRRGKALTEKQKKKLGLLVYNITYGDMPLQDGIDFVKLLVSTVIGISRFGIGAPTCGGDIDIAVVTREGFEWIKRKGLKG